MRPTGNKREALKSVFFFFPYSSVVTVQYRLQVGATYSEKLEENQVDLLTRSNNVPQLLKTQLL